MAFTGLDFDNIYRRTDTITSKYVYLFEVDLLCQSLTVTSFVFFQMPLISGFSSCYAVGRVRQR